MELKFDENLYILQAIPTIQGEGELSGVPSLLIRLAGCNLSCKWCDTKWSWKFDKHRDGAYFVDEALFGIFVSRLSDILKKHNLRNVMITGGEPFLYAKNRQFNKLLHWLEPRVDTIEIETNGTLIHTIYGERLSNNVMNKIRLNVSPKLIDHFYSSHGTYQEMVDNIVSCREMFHTSFKFVDSGKIDDRNEMEILIRQAQIPLDSIYIMPETPPKPKAGESYSEYLQEYTIGACHRTIRYCMSRGFRFSPRVHVFLFQDEFEKI